jgi:hypothetical protein
MREPEDRPRSGVERPIGHEAFVELKRAAPPEVSRWYEEGFYEHLFAGGRVELRYKELLRLKLSKTQGCFT